MINELELIENIGVLHEHKVVLYGAGSRGGKIQAELKGRGVHIHSFCDSNVKKWGLTLSGVKIISPAKLKQLDSEEEIVVIISSALFVEEIINMLESLELRTKYIATLFGLNLALNQNRTETANTFPEKWERVTRIYKKRENWRLTHIKNFMSASNILVYQPAKVGSQTIMNSLLAAGVTDSFLSGHLHTLNCTEMDSAVKELISLKLESLKAAGTIKIITLVREPVGRDLSFMFEVMGCFDEEVAAVNSSFIGTCSRRLEKIASDGGFLFNMPSNRYGFQFEWFDHEIKAVFDIDIFSHPFDREKGYSVIKQGNTEVLVMKLEKLDFLAGVVGEFVGVPDLPLIKFNESGDKQYKYLYPNVKEAIRIAPELISLYYDNNPRMNHFYTEEEKALFLKKWAKNIR